jgi:hypothetical protein
MPTTSTRTSSPTSPQPPVTTPFVGNVPATPRTATPAPSRTAQTPSTPSTTQSTTSSSRTITESSTMLSAISGTLTLPSGVAGESSSTVGNMLSSSSGDITSTLTPNDVAQSSAIGAPAPVNVALIGGLFGGLSLLCLLIGTLALFCWMRKKKPHPHDPHSDVFGATELDDANASSAPARTQIYSSAPAISASNRVRQSRNASDVRMNNTASFSFQSGMSSNSSTCTPAIVVGGAGAGGDVGTATVDTLAISASLLAAAASLGSPSTGRLLRSIAAIIFSFQLPRFKLPLSPNVDDDGDDAAESTPLPLDFFGVADGRFGLAGDVGAESPRGDIGGFVKSFSERVDDSVGNGDDVGTGDAALLDSGADATGTAAAGVPDPSLTTRDETTRSSGGGDAGVTAMVGVFDSSRRAVRQPFM